MRKLFLKYLYMIILILSCTTKYSIAQQTASIHNFNEKNIILFKINKTTLTEAKTILEGEPYLVSNAGNGNFMVVWNYDAPKESKQIITYFGVKDKKFKKVESYNGFIINDTDREKLGMDY